MFHAMRRSVLMRRLPRGAWRGEGAGRHIRAAAWLGSRQLAAAVVPLATVPVVVSHVDPTDYGRFLVVLTLVTWVSYLTAPAAAHAAEAAIARGQTGTFVFVLLRRLRLAALLAPVLALGVYVLLQGPDPRMGRLATLGAAYLVLGYVFQMFRSFLVAERAFNLLAPWDVAVTALPPLATAVAAMMTGSILAVAAASFAVQTALGMAATAWVIRRWRLVAMYRQGRIDPAAYPFGLRLVPVSLLVGGLEEAATFITMALVGYQGVAVFGVAYRLFDRLARMVMELARDLLRPVFAVGDETVVARRLREEAVWLTVGLLAVGVALAAAGVLYFRFVMPPAYRPAALYYGILMLAFPARVLWEVFNLLPTVNFRLRVSTVIHVTSGVVEAAAASTGAYLAGVAGMCVAIAASRWCGAILAYVLGIERRLRLARAPASG